MPDFWRPVRADADSAKNLFTSARSPISFTGSQVPPAPADGSQGNPLNNRRVSFMSDSGKVTSIVFTSTQNAFELDTLATGGVPEPATWGLMIAGFAMVGLGARKRRGVGSVAA